MTGFKAGYFAGSLATASINRLLARAPVRLAPPDGPITEDGQVTNPSVEDFLRNDMTESHGFIARVYTALPRN